MDQKKDKENGQSKSRQAFQRLLLKVVLGYAALSVALFFLFTTLMKNEALDDMAKNEVRHISQMVFESMYTAMLAGQGSAGIEAAARRMNQTGPGMIISVVRGETVAAQHGENQIDTMRRRNDLAIFDVFTKAEEQLIQKDNRVRYLFPALFREQCQACHLNAQPGEVAAVVEVIYPVEDLKVSTDYVNQLMLLYFLSSFVLLIGFLSWRYKD